MCAASGRAPGQLRPSCGSVCRRVNLDQIFASAGKMVIGRRAVKTLVAATLGSNVTFILHRFMRQAGRCFGCRFAHVAQRGLETESFVFHAARVDTILT